MNEPRYVAAIEISSSKVIGAVGKIYPDGKLEVIATEQEKCVECVRYGIVQNVEETAMHISRIISLLERKPEISPNKITGVYIGLSGRSLSSIDTTVELNLAEETIINDQIVERLRQMAGQKDVDSSLDIIDAVPRSFIIGKSSTKDPIGNLGKSIKATYDLIVCRPQLKRNIQSMDITRRMGINVNGFIVTPLATGQLIPNESEKRLGCMLVDIGAETTTVTIYKDGNLQYFATLPLGSRNITRDITSQNMLEEAAEDIKIQSGNALPSPNSTKLNFHGVQMADINDIIVSRAEEIMVNILEQITYAGLKDSELPGGIILIGGGARLNNFEELIRETSKMQVRRGQLPAPYISATGKTPSFEAIQVISILYAGATRSEAECLSKPVAAELPEIGDSDNDDDNNGNKRRTGREKRPSKLRSGRFAQIWKNVKDTLTPGDEEDDDNM